MDPFACLSLLKWSVWDYLYHRSFRSDFGSNPESEESSGKRALKKVCHRETDSRDVKGNGLMEGGGQPSLKSMLINGMSAAKNEEDYESDEFDLNKGDVITSIVDGMPNIRFS
ncbi:hypothetical protein J1N35_000254 [Gossypium stocksii]|uniref:Uncharacterized protein n=1 Tax=Gossypium stocksii TaxID=47602 RepID=A0A9D3WH51_9ROSI|nr:hypothetical protein J1N35_000254 [Gossypium stocksii]